MERPEGPSSELCHVAPEALAQIQELYDRGLMLQAFQVAKGFGPLSRWTGAGARSLAPRLAENLGAPRLGGVLHWRAWRVEKEDPDLRAYYTYVLLHRRGPLAAWEFLERTGSLPKYSYGEGLAHFYSVRCLVSAHLRDFSSAERWLAQASELTPDHPWVIVTHAHLLDLQDRHGSALETARRALSIRPWYRPGVHAVAHELQSLDRDEEALAFLSEADQHLESHYVTRQLAMLLIETGRYGEAATGLGRCEELAPLMEEGERLWLKRQRVGLACLRADTTGALHGARQIEEPYYQELAQRLEAGAPNRQVRLGVPFVRQHHMTCAPATLSALSRYWNQPAEHLEVAEAICYDGTPAHSERHWAETHGWVVREFTVTWEAAVALLDRGIPFTLTTTEATSGHLQAVIGYDELRQTFWIRDPFIYFTGEFVVGALLERYRATGPRGMALVPEGRRALFEDLELPDAKLYDQLYQAQSALARHDRAEALALCQEMQAAEPRHRLTLTARRATAAYDANTPALLECVTELLELFPADGNLNLSKLGCLRDLARREERLKLLQQLCAKPGMDPIFWQQYALELRADGRQLRAAASWVRWALRYRPTDPDLVNAWGDLLWDGREFARASRFYRLAACLADKREQFAQNFFVASRHLRETASALQFLRDRYERLGARSPDPGMTLVESLRHLGRTTEAFAVLEAALARRPEDGRLRLFAADFHGRFARFDSASRSLDEAQGRAPPAAWRRAAATLATYRSDKYGALQHWREVLRLEPLAHDAIRAAALLLAQTEGREAVLGFLDQLCGQFPFACPLLVLRVEWLRGEDPAGTVAAVRRLLEVNPVEVWGWRELAVQLAEMGKKEEALDAAQQAIHLAPNQSQNYCVHASLMLQSGRVEEAQARFREAVRLEVDNEYAVLRYVATAPTLADRKKALATVAEELRRQVIFGGALSAFQEAARGMLPSAEVLSLLREAHAARPDLWQSRSVLVHQLIDMGQHKEALQWAQDAVERFPLLAPIWVDLARVEHALLDARGETTALEKALELVPAYSHAARQLASIYERQNEFARAREVLERACVADPLEAPNHGCLGQVLWRLGERDQAVAKVQQALRLEPGYEWGWSALRDWGTELGRPALATELARDLTLRRAGEARSWLMLAKCLSPQAAPDELFAALDRALVLNPRSEESYDWRARALAELNRFDEALAQCAPASLQPTPARLKIRAAWVEAQRGNLPAAIVRAKAAVEEHPDSYTGWELLSEWYRETEQADEAVTAAEKMAGLAPLSAGPLIRLGDLKWRLRDETGAKAAFGRAFTLAPEATYAGFQLFHLQLASHELAEAESTLDVLCRSGKNHDTLACSIELAMARQEPARAQEQFESLCAGPKASEWSLAAASNTMDKGGLGRSVDRLIEQQLSQPDPGPALAELWVARQVGRGHWGLHARLNTLKAEGEPGRRAVLQYLDKMGESFAAARRKRDVTLPLELRYHFWRLLRKHRYWLEPDVEGWGKVGYVLTCIGRPGPVIDWLSDWKNRPTAQSWMLFNLVIMLQRAARYEEGLEVIRHAVTLRHDTTLYESFRLWAAFEETLAGNISLAEHHLATMPPDKITEDRRALHVMTQILIELGRTAPGDSKPSASSIRARLRTAFGATKPSQAERYTREAFGRFMQVASREAGGIGMRLWGWWYYRGVNWLWLALLLALSPMILAFPPLVIVPLVLIWRNRSRA